MLRGLYDNSGRLILFIFRRERIRIMIWFLGIVGMTMGVALAFEGMFTNQAEQQAMVGTMENPAMIAMVGPVYGSEFYTTGAMMANEMFLFTIIAAAMMNIFLACRYTRSDEEGGRTEVIRSLPVGRLASLNAMMVSALLINGALALLTGFGLYVLGIDSITLEGSLLYGSALGVSGFFFAAIAGMFAQLNSTSRGAMGYSLIILGILYLLRAMGDMDNETLSLVSPLGLILRTKVFVDDQWWPVPIVLLIALIVTAGAFYLNSRRDMGQGIIPAKPGRKTASPMLQSTLGLAFRLLRTTVIAWAIGIFVIAAAYGSIMGDLESFLNSNETYRMLLPEASGFTMTELFMTTIMSVMAMICAIPCLTIMIKLVSEEKHGRIDHLLAGSVSRYRLMGSYLMISLISSLVMYCLSAFGLWSAARSVMDDPLSLGLLMKAQMAYLPAVWVMIGITALLIGLIPRLTSLIWLYLFYTFFTVYFGGLLKLPEWTKDITSFGQTPQYPVEEIGVVPLMLMILIAVLFGMIGLTCYRRRNLH